MGRERRRRSQNWSVKWPQIWAANAAVKTSCATASHPQPRHKALSEDLLGQDAHVRRECSAAAALPDRAAKRKMHKRTFSSC